MNIDQQLEAGILVSPGSRRRLRFSTDRLTLETEDGVERYTLLSGTVPVLLTDPEWARTYAASSERMTHEYQGGRSRFLYSFFRKIKNLLTSDYQSAASRRAWAGVLKGLPPQGICLSVGGGPFRPDPRIVNLNIGPFPNVDVVADAHKLPYGDGSVDAAHCVAVLEHLRDPRSATAELFRVLKPGGRAYIDTPFMQGYHGYPNHFQNFTLSGHANLLESAGFMILESGCSVGPVCAVATILSIFLREYLPRPLNRLAQALWWFASIAVRPLDLFMARRSNAYVLASSTYLVVQKRGSMSNGSKDTADQKRLPGP